MKYAIEVASCGIIYIPSFLEIDTDVQVVFKVLPQDGLKCSDIHAKFHKDWLSHSNIHRQQGHLISLLITF
jgi:hypothetical protein